jgi:hypothetical protein
MTLASAFPEVRRRLEAWCGFPALSEALHAHPDVRIHVAGGAIRNVLMGLASQSKDWDFFLSGPSVNAFVSRMAAVGRLEHTPYGAPRWHPPQDAAQYADLMPVRDFVPGLWPCEDIVDVLDQFDFTANAVAFDLRTGEAFDPQNGARDAMRRIMKMVRFDYPAGPYVAGAPLDRNTVLWFRVLHYASTLQLGIEPLTRAWLTARGGELRHAATFARHFFAPNLQAWEALHGR